MSQMRMMTWTKKTQMMTWMFDWPGIGREEKDLGPITILPLFVLALPCPCPPPFVLGSYEALPHDL